MTARLRQAFFGGSFDPIHLGHLLVAEMLCDLEELDRVCFVPTYRSPHKSSAEANSSQRISMLQRALRGNPRLTWDRIEVRRARPSFTIETIRALAKRWGEKPAMIVGGDSLIELETWKESEAILKEARIIVFGRPGFEAAATQATRLGMSYHEVELTSISSSMIRQRVRRCRSIRYQVPDGVRLYIEKHSLYQEPRRAGRPS